MWHLGHATICVPWIKGISLDERRVMERTPITTPTPSCKASSEIGMAVFVQIVKHHRLVVEPKMPADRAMERCVKIMLLEVTSRILT
jgi:hypothetical protein